jgi:hypothetical protein
MDKAKNQAADAEEQKQKRQKSEHVLFLGAKRALVGSLLAGGIAFLGHLLVGRVYSGTEARSLLEAMVPSARSTGTAVVTASGTILALMLTMLSISRDATSKLEAVFFQRVERIGLLSTIALISSILLMLMLSIPLQESNNLPGSWYSIVYYVLIALTAAVSGLLVAIILMLYNALQSLIEVLRPTSSSADSQEEG